eukprot:gb/GEZJ01002064.1/.p1 GENE.gb/GEZJ01002064.1/~~gb/GEZJ01002064.1/.p1  ORF type:complete len:278 (-),score=6.26 gb/GEZJ01002064.1/:745-1578(-)
MDRDFSRSCKEHGGRKKRSLPDGSRSPSRFSCRNQNARNDVGKPDAAQIQRPLRRTKVSIRELLNPNDSEQILQSPRAQSGLMRNSPELDSQSTRPESGHAGKRSRVLGEVTDLLPKTLIQLSVMGSASGAGPSSGVVLQRTTEGGSAEENRRSHNGGGAAQSHKLCCEICGKMVHWTSITQHRATHNPNRERHSCRQCEKSYMSKGALTKHMQIHDPRCRFYCSGCDKQFISRSHLERHMHVHDPQTRPRFECDGCGKTFVQRWCFTKHKREACRR